MVVRLVGVPWDATTLGRSGARFAPEAIRRELGRLHPYNAEQGRSIAWLAGKDLPLSEDHADMQRSVTRAAEQEAKTDPEAPLLLLGGDHAISYAGVSAVQRRFPRLHLVSLDAHLDLRPREDGPSNGNWALRAVEDLQVPYTVVGVGQYANDLDLFYRAKSLGAAWVRARSIRTEGPRVALEQTLAGLEGEDLYLSLDMDVMDQSLAPGVSAPSPEGLQVADVQECLRLLLGHAKLRGFDITEVNPNVDPAGLTPRLAAHLLLEVLSTLGT